MIQSKRQILPVFWLALPVLCLPAAPVWASSLKPVSAADLVAKPAPATGASETATQCRPVRTRFGCGGARAYFHGRWDLARRARLQELKQRLEENPRDEERVWQRLFQIWDTVYPEHAPDPADPTLDERLADSGTKGVHRTEAARRMYRNLHWQDADGDPLFSSEDDLRLPWLDLWRRSRPRDREAWRRWTRQAIADRGVATVIAELELEAASDPSNPTIQAALLGARQWQAQPPADGHTDFSLPDLETPVLTLPFDAALLPESIRDAFTQAWHHDWEAALKLLERHLEAHPSAFDGEPELELVYLDLQSGVGDMGDAEHQERVQALEGRASSVWAHYQICGRITTPDGGRGEDDCRKRVFARAEAAGLHLRGARVSDATAGRGGHIFDHAWNLFLSELQDQILHGAVETRDFERLRTLLIDGHEMGRAELWRDAVDLMNDDVELVTAIEAHLRSERTSFGYTDETLNDPDIQAEAIEIGRSGVREMFRSSCELLREAHLDGGLDGHVLGGADACPRRFGAMDRAFEICDLAEGRNRLITGLGERLPELGLAALQKLDMPLELKIGELERRRWILKPGPERRGIDDLLANLRVGSLLSNEKVLDDLAPQFQDWAATDPWDLKDWLLERDRVPLRVSALAAEALLQSFPEAPELHLRVAFEAVFPMDAPQDLDRARVLVDRAMDAASTRRQIAEAHFLKGRLLIDEGQPEQATEPLAVFYDALLEAGSCPVMFPDCDRDYLLHLLAVGDRPRFDDYHRRRAKAVDEIRAEMKARGLQTENPALIVAKGFRLLRHDELVDELFVETDCGLLSALPHLQQTTQEDPQLARRLELETNRSCRRLGPKPWQRFVTAGAARAFATLLLVADEFPETSSGLY